MCVSVCVCVCVCRRERERKIDGTIPLTYHVDVRQDDKWFDSLNYDIHNKVSMKRRERGRQIKRDIIDIALLIYLNGKAIEKNTIKIY